MKTLSIDDKWSVEYDPENNDRPTALLRYGDANPLGVKHWKNDSYAMFQALLDARNDARQERKTPKLTDAEINEITMNTIGKWPSFVAQSWANKVVHAVMEGRLSIDDAKSYGDEYWMESGSAEVSAPKPNPSELAFDDEFVAQFLNALSQRIHAINVAAGWWTDLKTGESLLRTRNVPEMLMLIVSEVSEAMEAHRKNLMDDKLPHRPGLQTELADAIIRILDLAGSRTAIEGMDYARSGAWLNSIDFDDAEPINPIGDIMIEKINFNHTRPDHQIENRLKEGGKKI